jgi:hypothetical protein
MYFSWRFSISISVWVMPSSTPCQMLIVQRNVVLAQHAHKDIPDINGSLKGDNY